MMENYLYATFQLMNIALLLAWLALSLFSLFQLRSRNLSGGLKLGWTLVILLVPVIGAVSFLIVVPKEKKSE